MTRKQRGGLAILAFGFWVTAVRSLNMDGMTFLASIILLWIGILFLLMEA